MRRWHASIGLAFGALVLYGCGGDIALGGAYDGGPDSGLPSASSSGAGSGSSSGGSTGGGSGGNAAGFVPVPPDEILDGGASGAAVTKTACSDDLTRQLPYTRGILIDGGFLDISQATGYNPDPSIPGKAAAMLPPGDRGARANQMRGTPPLLSAGSPQYVDLYRTLDDPATGIKGLAFRDGPRGVNLRAGIYTGPFGGQPEAISAPSQIGGYSTAFPTTVSHAAAWDIDLENQLGQDLGDEMLASGNTVALSPCVNILRHPAWGRAQETYGEDTFATGRMASAYVDGVQHYIPACVKHFMANNIEDGRSFQNAVMDDQTLHEIYGRHFEMIVQEAAVACVMASLNSVNGTKDTQNKFLLTDVLRNTFGFKGFVVSDWWAMPGAQNYDQMASTLAAQAEQAIGAGLDVEMPWELNFANIEADTNITLDELTTAATDIIQQKLRFNIASMNATTQLGLQAPTSKLTVNYGITNNDAHLSDAERLAEEAMVLLKNDKNTLPINRSSVHTIAVIGGAVPWQTPYTQQQGTFNFATDVRIGDNGSSTVVPDPAKSVGPAAGIQLAAGTGINVVSGTDPSLANNADFIVLVAGLTPEDEGEEFTGAGDRTDSNGNPNFDLDAKTGTGAQNMLIQTVAATAAAANTPMVVVLEGGSAINMPWISSVPAVVMAWYPGQVGGVALGKLLFGDVNFSGKLPITWPVSEADEPAFNMGGTQGGETMMDYYLGYRYFDFYKKTPLFAYGSGKSYTTFQYDSLGVPCSTVTKHGVVDVTVAVTNTGPVPGNEVSFLFVSYPMTQARRSVKELKGFHRTPAPLMPGQTDLFTIRLRIQDLKYWDTTASDGNGGTGAWNVESGPVQIMVGPSSDKLPLMDTLIVQ
jgi:beta-glucosidase